MPALELDGRRLWYEDGGDGPPLVLSHGSIESSRSWEEVAPRLRERFRVVAYDFRGLGRSDPAPFDFAGLAADVAALAERLELGRFCHAGHSLGGRVALEHALAYPGQLVAVAAVSARVEASSEATRERLERLRETVRRDGTGAAAAAWIEPEHPLHGRAATISGENSLDGTLASLACARDADGSLAPRLGELAMPVLAVVGERDERYLDSAQAIAAAPQGELRVVPDVGHFPNLEAPEELAEILTEFFDRYT